MSLFSSTDNIQLLWSITLDELPFTKQPATINTVKMIFDKTLEQFTNKYATATNIPVLEQNKLFLFQVMTGINKVFPPSSLKKINITNEDVSIPYKIEDIQTERQQEFHRLLKQKQEDMEYYLTPQKPTEPNFAFDNDLNDEKIVSMDLLVAKKIAERNELTINDIVTTADKQDKRVSWDTSETFFNKLKHINVPTIPKVPIIDDVTHQRNVSYDSQESAILPQQIPPDITNTTNIPTNTTISSSTAVLPKNEIIKQLNMLNEKIDMLFDLISNNTCNCKCCCQTALDNSVDTL